MNQNTTNFVAIMIAISGVFLFVGSLVLAKIAETFFLSFLSVIIGGFVGLGIFGTTAIGLVINYDKEAIK